MSCSPMQDSVCFPLALMCCIICTDGLEIVLVFSHKKGIQARVSADLEWIDSQVCALSTNPPKDFDCSTLQQEYKQNQTSSLTRSKALFPSMPLDLSEDEGVLPFWPSGVVFCVLVLFGAMALQRVVVRRSQRVNYTTL